MTINISIPDVEPNLHPKITVLGVGGSGGNAVNNMMNSNLEGVDFLIANTDAQALKNSTCKNKIQLGLKSTRGLGAGMRPDIGRQAAEEAINEINEKLEGSHMIFIAAGMGGGTGTGAAPVIAKLAREQGILTVGVVTKPFHFEGSQRMKLAEKGINELQQFVDTLLTIPNQNLFRIANEKTTFADAFKMADDVLYAGVRGVTDLMVQPGLINLDFSDVKTVMSEMGKAMMGTGEASGEGRAIAAAEAAIANPLIDDVSLKGARGLIINITGGNDITLYEVDEAANRIKQEVDESANIIYGTTCDDRLEGVVRVSLVATGIDVDAISAQHLAQSNSMTVSDKSISIDNSVYKEKPIEEIENTTNHHDETALGVNDSIDYHTTNASEPLKVEENLFEESQSSENFSDNNFNETLNENFDDVDTEDHNKIIKSEDHSDYEEAQDIERENVSENRANINEKLNDFNESDQISDPKVSVRKLSLFDTLEEKSDTENKTDSEKEQKSEPILYNHTEEQENDSLEKANEDFNLEEDKGDEFNQDNEEDLLDIPTFLRRQAN